MLEGYRTSVMGKTGRGELPTVSHITGWEAPIDTMKQQVWQENKRKLFFTPDERVQFTATKCRAEQTLTGTEKNLHGNKSM